ncbi:MAG: mandelate racemase/muconate lactonizing enzyme family protein [Acidimicrobiales bacterium]
MRIVRVDAVHVVVPMTSPFRKAGRVQHDCDNALVRIETDDGIVGWGEAASAPLLTGDTGARIASSIHYLADGLIGRDPRSTALLHRDLSAAMLDNHSAVCAIDIALHDIAGRALGVPIFQLIGGRSRENLPASVGLNAEPEEAAKAKEWLDLGAAAFKAKVSLADPGYEQAALGEIRAALGPDSPLAIDANGAWTPAEALRFLDAVADLDLAFCEQPIASGSLSRLRSVAERSPVPIYADESFREPADLISHAEAGVAGVSMKTIKMGGITGFMLAAYLARLLELGVNVAGKSATSSIGGSAMLHIGTALPEMSGGIGLSNHKLVEDLAVEPVGLTDGALRAPTGPGLGIEVDESVVDRHTATRTRLTA